MLQVYQNKQNPNSPITADLHLAREVPYLHCWGRLGISRWEVSIVHHL